MDATRTQQAKRAAYAAAKRLGLTIEYEISPRHWTVNVCAPDGMTFGGGEHTLVTEWMTKPDERFWQAVQHDITTNAAHLIPED